MLTSTEESREDQASDCRTHPLTGDDSVPQLIMFFLSFFDFSYKYCALRTVCPLIRDEKWPFL